MRYPHNYAEYAQECLRSASATTDVTEKKLFLEMADAWIHIGLAQADVFTDPEAIWIVGPSGMRPPNPFSLLMRARRAGLEAWVSANLMEGA